MGTVTAPVAGSGSCPSWIARVSKSIASTNSRSGCVSVALVGALHELGEPVAQAVDLGLVDGDRGGCGAPILEHRTRVDEPFQVEHQIVELTLSHAAASSSRAASSLISSSGAAGL